MFDLGKILRQLREKHGYTQSEVAKKVNVSPGAVLRWENNGTEPSTEKLIELSILYNIPINYLIGIPLEDTLPIDRLSPDEQKIIQSLVAEFKRKKIAVVPGKYTREQQTIINALFEAFYRQ